MMSNDLIGLAVDCGLMLALLMALVFFLDQLGLRVWIWRISRSERQGQHSSAKKCRRGHE